MATETVVPCVEFWQEPSDPACPACRTCGAAEAAHAQEISPDVREVLAAAGTTLGAVLSPLVGKVEQARDIAADLEAELAACRAHLQAVVPLAASTWAQDSAKIDAARVYLNAIWE